MAQTAVQALSTCVTPTLTFEEGWTTTESAPPMSGADLEIIYNAARLPKCRGAGWSIAVDWSTDGSPHQTQLLTSDGVSVPTKIAVKPGKSLAMWFFNSDETGCQAYDSRYGANYDFTLAANSCPSDAGTDAARTLYSADLEISQCVAGNMCPTESNPSTPTDVVLSFTSASDTVPCTNTTTGACTVSICSALEAGTVPFKQYSAGSVMLTGSGLGTFSYNPTSGYSEIGVGTPIVRGTQYSVKASGGTVPAFGPFTLVAPGPVILTQPAADATGAFTIPTHGDVEVTWSSGQSGAALFFTAVGNNRQVTCDWDAGLGEAVIPESVIAALAGQSGALYWGQQVGGTFDSSELQGYFAVFDYGLSSVSFE